MKTNIIVLVVSTIMIMLPVSACITDQKQTDTTDSDAIDWSVNGRVVDSERRPSRGLIVSLYDKDFTYDDKLGEAITDESGSFKITFGRQDFDDEEEKLPDLYVVITDSKRNVLYSSYDDIEPSVSLLDYYIHYYEITLPDK